MRPYTLAAITLSLSVASGLALAQSAFEMHDNNGDGKLSKDEFYGVAQDVGIFADYDANRDRRLDETEFDAFGVDADFDSWDIDGDSYLDTNELNDGIYDWYDADGDGYWDADESDTIPWL